MNCPSVDDGAGVEGLNSNPRDGRSIRKEGNVDCSKATGAVIKSVVKARPDSDCTCEYEIVDRRKTGVVG